MNVQKSSAQRAIPLKLPFLSGGAELGELMRERDWSQTPVGPAEHWPQSLRTVINIVLTSRYAMWMGWGEELTFFYNDAYRPTLGIKHPWALGNSAREVWAEIWRDVGPRIDAVLTTGQATYDEGLLLFLERSGFPEETYHTFSYSPLADDNGKIAGMLCVVTEETERIIGERRMALLRELASELAASNTQQEVLAAVERQLGNDAQDLPFTLTYLFDNDGSGGARLACATGIKRGHPAAPEIIPPGSLDAVWPAAEIFSKAASVAVEDLSARLGGVSLPAGAWDRSPESAVIVPVKKQGQDRPAGFLVAAINPYRRYDAPYAGFIDLLAGQVAAGLSNAQAYEAERKRAEALAELDRAKTVFFSNVSHEFRTPLTLMLGPVEDMLAKGEGEGQVHPENRELLAVVHRNGLRLQRLVNTLLDFSRIEAGRAEANYEPTDLGAFTAELGSSFRSAMERAGLQFSIECPPLSQPVHIDRDMWEKIVLNLVSNAFKYTLDGSVAVRLAERGDQVEFSVADTGIGISEGELTHVFQRFHRVEGTRGRTHEGTGIGLALVQELVKLHGGTVGVTSTFERGSTFTVCLPFGTKHLPQDRVGANRKFSSTALHADTYVEEALRWLPEEAASEDGKHPVPADQIAPATEAESFRSAPRNHVLLADDNADMRDYVRRLLSAHYEVTALADGQEALASALANPPDLVLADVMMPVLDGFGLLRGLRAHPSTRSIPVLLLSARAGEEASIQGLEAGADDYLVKPFTARELLARVGAHLALKRERQRAHELLTQVFSQAPVAICVLRGREMVFELANQNYRDLLRGRDLVGRRLADVMPELDTRTWEVLYRVLDTGEAFVASEFRISFDQDRDGVPEDHWFNLVFHPLREVDDTVSGIIGVGNEVTVQVRAREELVRANRELEEFAYVASHDLQEPLRTVNIYTQLLLRRCGLQNDAEAGEFSEFVRNGVQRMEFLIKDLLAYSRVVHPEQDEARPADLNRSLEETLKTLHGLVQETGAVISHDKLPTVRGDERQFAQVFQNLLSNALKYRQEGEAPRVHIAAERHSGEWLVSVRDNGIGFAPQHAERIFGLFKRLHKDSYPGTGLGLAICKRVVERYGGRIWAASEGEGCGSSFYFTLRPEGG